MTSTIRKLALAGGVAGALVGGSLLWTSIERRPLRYATEPILLEAEVFHTGEHLAIPVDLELAGGVLLAIDRHGAKSLHVIDASDGSLLASVGNPGEGPAEFMAPATITRDRAGRVWVLDLTTQRMSRIDLGRLDDPTAWADSSFQLHGALVTDLSWTSDQRLIAGGVFPEARFGLLDGSGTLTAQTGRFPDLERDLPAVLRQQAFESRFAPHPDGRRFAVAARYAGRIDLIDDRGASRGAVTAPLPFEPEFEVRRRGDFPIAAFPPESTTGYIDVAGTRDFVLGLFSGRTEADFPGRDNYASDIHVFDWSGALIAVLRTDRDIFAITVDEAGGRLLAIAHDPVPAILAFALPVLATPGGALAAAPEGASPAGE